MVPNIIIMLWFSKALKKKKKIPSLEILNVWICLFVLVSKKELGHFFGRDFGASGNFSYLCDFFAQR